MSDNGSKQCIPLFELIQTYNNTSSLIAEIQSLRAQLAEARDKALGEAAAVAGSYQWSATVPAWAVIQNAILALRGAKP